MSKITLETARTSAGLTRREIADKIGVSYTSVVNWEKGNAKIKTIHLIAFCNVAGCSVNDILLPARAV